MLNKTLLFFRSSFIPYVLLIVMLIVFVQYMDTFAHKNKSEIIIELNSENQNQQGSQTNFNQLITLKNKFPVIYNLIKDKKYLKALALLRKQKMSKLEKRMTSIICYYYLQRYEAALAVLKKIPDDRPEKLYYGGLIYLNQKNYEKAKNNFSKLIANNNTYPSAYYNLALISYRKAKYSNAETKLSRYLKNYHGKDSWRANLLLAKTYQRLKKPKLAFEQIKLGLRKNPSNTKLRIKYYSLMLVIDKQNAVREISDKLAKNPGIYEAYMPLIDYFIKNKKRSDASHYLKRALRYIHNNNELIRTAGITYLKLKEYQNAIVFLEKYWLKKQTSTTAYNLGLAYSGLKKYEQAIAKYKLALRKGKNFNKALVNLGVIYTKSKKYQEAKKYYMLALNKSPNKALIYYNLGILSNKLKAHLQAILYFQKAIHLKKDYASAWLNLGFSQSKSGDKVSAEKSYRKAFLLKPSYEKAVLNLIDLLDNLGKIQDALKLAIQFTATYRSPRILVSAGNIHLELEHFSKAILFYQKALKYNAPNNTYYLLALTQLKLNDNVNSIKSLQKFLYYFPASKKGRKLYIDVLEKTGNAKELKRQREIYKKI